MNGREKLLAMSLGETKVFSLPAKVLLGKVAQSGVNNGLHHTMLVGSGFTTDKMLAPENGWEMLECEIIIIPKTLHSKNKEPEFEHLDASRAMTSHCWNADRWKEHKNLNNI